MLNKKLYKAAAAIASLAAVTWPTTTLSAPSAEEKARVDKVAATLAAEMARLCPPADPGAQAAFDTCRQGLFKDSQFRRSLMDFVLWGRQRDPNLKLKETKLTQFGPDVLSGMYMPLFMFNGKYEVVHVEREGLYQIRLQTAFRNRLAPGQFPYPFWHEAEKWAMYEKANDLILWWDPTKDRIRFAQFTVFGKNPPVVASSPVTQQAFDGKWMWTDAQGKTQPAVTLFDGLLRADNPHIGKVETAYKAFALRLRDGQCFECHVPNNPDGMKKLVLLQTPMHAASEIKRVMKSVRENKMPLDQHGDEKPLDANTKSVLLAEGAAFEKVLDLARQWEASNAKR